MPEKQAVRLGYISVCCAALLWAASGNVSKFLLQSEVSPFQLVQLRTTLAAALLFLFLLVRRRDLLKIARSDVLYFIILGTVLAVMLFAYLYAISRIHVAAAVLLQYQAPALIALYSFFFHQRKLSAFTVVAIVGAIIGCYLMVGAYNLNILNMNKAGILSGLASAVALALYSVRSEYGMRTYSAWTVLSYALLVAAIIWNILIPPLAAFAGKYSASAWGWLIFISLFGTIAPFGLYSEGIKRIHSTHASITATLEPVMAGLIAYALLGEVMELPQLIGAGTVIGAILLLPIEELRVAGLHQQNRSSKDQQKRGRTR
ncbi:MAG: EamA family transporter [Nitrospirae bacterium]|nr:EamA family transporter [Nitrospirota bacterium]